MTDPMDQPVTKRELQASFDAFLERLDQRFEKIDQRFEQVDQRFEQMQKQMDERFADAHRGMLSVVRGSAKEIRLEIRTLDRANEVRHREDLEILDAKYATLPARVKKLEAAVFKPAPLKRRRSR